MSGIFKGSMNGVLGAPMSAGPGISFQDGSLGAPMARGGGIAWEDGSLGCATCGFKGLGETSVAVPTTLILGALIGAAATYWMLGKDNRARA